MGCQKCKEMREAAIKALKERLYKKASKQRNKKN